MRQWGQQVQQLHSQGHHPQALQRRMAEEPHQRVQLSLSPPLHPVEVIAVEGEEGREGERGGEPSGLHLS